MRKKGFTLIEIIISIGLILIIGIISIFSFNITKKKEIENNLRNKSTEILTATNLYLETNNNIKEKLYLNKNGVAIPLKVLEKEGLIDFNGLNIKDEHVITMLGSEIPGEECVSTYTIKSWEFPEDKVIYICTKEENQEFNIINEMKKNRRNIF